MAETPNRTWENRLSGIIGGPPGTCLRGSGNPSRRSERAMTVTLPTCTAARGAVRGIRAGAGRGENSAVQPLGRFAGVTCSRHGLGRPETFEFLGFKHVCGVDRAGRFALIRIPSVKSCRKFLGRTRELILQNRQLWRQNGTSGHGNILNKMLRGDFISFAYRLRRERQPAAA